MTTNKMKKFYFIFIACIFIAFAMPMAFAEITGVSAVSPANDARINDSTPDFTFNAVSNSSATFSCSLYIDGVSAATGLATNNTNTVLTSGVLAQGSHSWYINCTDTNSRSSAISTINIDTIAPVVALESPSNSAETSSHEIIFKIKATDNIATSTTCKLYVNGSEKEHTDASNNSNEEFDAVSLTSGSHSWYVKCTDATGNTGTSETRTLEVLSFCDDGECGDLSITDVSEPDSGDSFAPGENITIKVKVKNNANDDLDVVIYADLYDSTEDDSITDDEVTTTIKEDDSETVTLYITIPSDANADDDYTIRVKAYEEDNEDEHCSEDGVNILIEREKYDVSFDKLEISPDTIPCGNTANLAFKVSNTGEEDDDMKIDISSSFFSWTKTFSLDSEDDYSSSVPIVIPTNISEGAYTITAKTYYDKSGSSYRKSKSETITLNVQGNCAVASQPGASIEPSQLSDAFAGSDFSVKLKITNTGNGRTTYTIGASNYSGWATMSKIDPQTLTLDAGASGYAYITLNPNDDSIGTNSFKATVAFGSTVKEQAVSVSIKKSTEPATWFDRFMFELKRNALYASLLIVLVLIVIVLVIMLARQSRSNARKARDDRFSPAEITIRKAGSGKKSRLVKNF